MRNSESPFLTQTEYVKYADAPDTIHIMIENYLLGKINLPTLQKLKETRMPNSDVFDVLKYILNEN